MTASKRVQQAKSSKYHNNIHRRGNVDMEGQKKQNQFPVGPIVLAFFLFVVVGSAVLQVVSTASSTSNF